MPERSEFILQLYTKLKSEYKGRWDKEGRNLPESSIFCLKFAAKILLIYFCLVFPTEESLLKDVTEKSALYLSKINMEFIN